MKNVREIGPGREQDDITGNYSKFREMISYARMHEGSENRVYYFQSMAHGDVEKQKCIGLVPTKAWELYHSKLLPRQKKLYKGTINGSCTSQWLQLDRMRVKNQCKTIEKV